MYVNQYYIFEYGWKLNKVVMQKVHIKDMGGSQRDNDSSPNLSFNDLKQKEIEIKEGSARVLWYETQLLIGQPNGGSPKF